MKITIRVNQIDNVVTVTDKLNIGEEVPVLSEEGNEIERIRSLTEVPLPFHKIALQKIAKGEEIKKYGEVIGHASKPIRRGEWVHVHNIESASLPEKEVK